MTNKEKLAQMGTDELGDLFCGTMEKIAEKAGKWIKPEAYEGTEAFICKICPVSDICAVRHNGFTAWLEKEAN